MSRDRKAASGQWRRYNAVGKTLPLLRRWCIYCLCEGVGLASIGSPVCKADQKICCIKSQGQGDLGQARLNSMLGQCCPADSIVLFVIGRVRADLKLCTHPRFHEATWLNLKLY